MSRAFTTREKVLLLILVALLLLIGYVLMVHQPVAKAKEQATLRLQEADSAIILEEARAEHKQKMQTALVELEAAEGQQSETPDYDNIVHVTRVLYDALDGAEAYSLAFQTVSFEGHLASRTIDIQFTCESYVQAKAVLTALYHAPYRCTIADFSVEDNRTVQNKTGDLVEAAKVTAKLTITFFEYVEHPPEAEVP